MNEQDKHKWKKVDVPDNQKDSYSEKRICIRGDCKCVRLKYKYSRDFTYIRDHHATSWRPDCFGDTPINEQTID